MLHKQCQNDDYQQLICIKCMTVGNTYEFATDYLLIHACIMNLPNQDDPARQMSHAFAIAWKYVCL
jgi:hypothetical protein